MNWGDQSVFHPFYTLGSPLYDYKYGIDLYIVHTYIYRLLGVKGAKVYLTEICLPLLYSGLSMIANTV